MRYFQFLALILLSLPISAQSDIPENFMYINDVLTIEIASTGENPVWIVRVWPASAKPCYFPDLELWYNQARLPILKDREACSAYAVIKKDQSANTHVLRHGNRFYELE